MQRSGRETGMRLVILLAGLGVAHLGVTLFLFSELGADPFNVLVQGVYRTLLAGTGWTFLTHGRVHIALCLLIIVVLLATDRRYVKAGTVVCMVFGGPIIDLFTLLLSPLARLSLTLPARLLLLGAGCVILAFGMTVVIQSDAGTGPNDLVAVVLSDKLHRKFSIVRVLVDAAFVLTGFLLGGSVGVGTLVCVALVGPAAGFFMPYSQRIVAWALKRSAGPMCG